jgi:hypothetical protein
MKRDLLLCYAPKQPATSITNFTTPLPRHELVDSWGHSLQPIDTSTTFWIFLQNPNGLSLTYRPESVLYDFPQSREYGAAILCLPETNINWNAPDQFQIFQMAAIRQSTTYSISRQPEDFLSQYQPGGTTTILFPVGFSSDR